MPRLLQILQQINMTPVQRDKQIIDMLINFVQRFDTKIDTLVLSIGKTNENVTTLTVQFSELVGQMSRYGKWIGDNDLRLDVVEQNLTGHLAETKTYPIKIEGLEKKISECKEFRDKHEDSIKSIPEIREKLNNINTQKKTIWDTIGVFAGIFSFLVSTVLIVWEIILHAKI